MRSACISWMILDCMLHSLSTIIYFARSNPHWYICKLLSPKHLKPAYKGYQTMKGDILCNNTKRSVWLQNYHHALSGAFIQTKNKQNSFRGRREAIFCCTIPFQFHCQNNSKVQQSSQRAASQVLDNKKALFQNHIFKNVIRKQQFTKGVFGWVLL